MERTLVLLKPDAVQRGLVGRVLQRFEDAGFKIIGMKMVQADETLARKHYDEDVERRRGKEVRDWNVAFLKEAPVIAIVLQGLHAVENVRKMVGGTEPRSAVPGTIRGDFSHMSFESSGERGIAIKNLIHASANAEDAKKEIPLWFGEKELKDYALAHENQVY